MIGRMLAMDFGRKKTITAALFAFIALSATLASGGARIIIELSGALDSLFEAADPPDYVQMHAGELIQNAIDSFAKKDDLVVDYAVIETIAIDGRNLTLGRGGQSEAGTVMDIALVKQNVARDIILDLLNDPIRLGPGEVAVPVYFMQKRGLTIGDPLELRLGDETFRYTIAAFARDAMMNPAFVSSKRLVLSDTDFLEVGTKTEKREYLIEFWLQDPGRTTEFEGRYREACLPQKGPAVTGAAFRLLNGIGDGMLAGIIILIALFFTFISILCLRFVMTAALEEEYREIGVMKAIGLPGETIKRLYLVKYLAIAAAGVTFGSVLSHPFAGLFMDNILLYMGTAAAQGAAAFVSIAVAGVIFGIIALYCVIALRRFDGISAVDAIREGNLGVGGRKVRLIPLGWNRILSLDAFLGISDTLRRFRSFRVIFLVYLICASIMIVPRNFLSTVDSPDFVRYMGIGACDVRIDLRQTDGVSAEFRRLVDCVAADPDVERSATLVTSRFEFIDADGRVESLDVESGDLGVFPLDYLEGAAPENEGEIALSYLCAKDLGKTVGDGIDLVVGGAPRSMRISGLYQDITNGGKTAKSPIPPDPATLRWCVVNLDLRDGADVEAVMATYREAFPGAKVNHIASYVRQTLGGTIEQLRSVVVLGAVMATVMTTLITALFTKMLMAKDFGQIAIMRCLGFSVLSIRLQYIYRSLFAMAVGIILGVLVSNTLGQALMGLIGSAMGASKIDFQVDPLVSYVAYPALLFAVAAGAAFLSSSDAGKSGLSRMIAE